MKAICLILLVFFARTSPHVQMEGDVFLSGRVLDSQGRPVADARIDFWPSAGTVAMQNFATTTPNGYFLLRTQPVGEGTLSASKPEAGYPDAKNALYAKEGLRSRVQINAKPGHSPDPVTLTFDAPNAVLRWKIQSASQRVKLPGAYIHIALASNPKIVEYGMFPVDREFIFVLPRRPITITISYTGFHDWTPAGTSGLSYPLALAPGTVDRRVIQLEPK